MRVAVGGTFDILHVGHEALLKKAIDTGGKLLVGLTSDEMARRTRKRVSPYALRKRNLESYLRRKGAKGFEIVRIDDELGPAVSEELDALVVSAEKRAVAVRINEERAMRGFPPLDLFPVPMVLAEDCLPISSMRIRAKEVDRTGRMLRTLVINVGTNNRLKVSAIKTVASKLYSKVKVRGVSVESGVPSEPLEQDVVLGAINRARRALGGGDFGVGIEAGLFWNESIRDHLDVQYCAVVDKAGRLTVGHGPGFAYPPAVVSLVEKGMTVGQAMERITGIKGMGSKQGAIGYLSHGRLDREEITKMAIFTAFLPRIRRDLYL